MLEIYGDFMDADMVDSILEKQGLKLVDEPTRCVTFKQCPRYHAILAPEAKACHQCALILDASLSKEKELVEDKMQRALLKMMEHQEVRTMLKEIVDILIFSNTSDGSFEHECCK